MRRLMDAPSLLPRHLCAAPKLQGCNGALEPWTWPSGKLRRANCRHNCTPSTSARATRATTCRVPTGWTVQCGQFDASSIKRAPGPAYRGGALIAADAPQLSRWPRGHQVPGPQLSARAFEMGAGHLLIMPVGKKPCKKSQFLPFSFSRKREREKERRREGEDSLWKESSLS